MHNVVRIGLCVSSQSFNIVDGSPHYKCSIPNENLLKVSQWTAGHKNKENQTKKMKMLPAAARWRHHRPWKAFSERRRPSARSFKRLRIPNELPASTARAGQGARVENSTNSFPRVAAPHLLLVSAGKPAGEHHRPAAHSHFLESCCSWFQRVTKWKPGWLSSEMTKVVTSKNSALSSCT